MPTLRPLLQDALAGSAYLGTWAYDAANDRFVPPPPLAALLGIAPGTARRGAALARAVAAMHGEDRERAEVLLRAASEETGPFEAEFRVTGGGKALRWLRLMGRSDRRSGSVRGLAFDLTEGRTGRGDPARQAQDRANRLADHAIAMKRLVADLSNRPLALAVDRVAVEIGFELARHLRAADEPRH